MGDNDPVTQTLGASIGTSEVVLATIVARDDGTIAPFSRATSVRPEEGPADALARLLHTCSDVDHVVLDIGAVVDDWLAVGAPLGAVTVLRVTPSANTVAEPFGGWPDHLRTRVDGGWVNHTGGVDLHGGRVIASDSSALSKALALAAGNESVAVCVSAMGALVDPEVEHHVAEQLLREAPHQRVVLANEAGGRRYLEREQAAILSACLGPATSTLLDDLQAVADRAGVTVSLSGADGGRLAIEDGRSMPSRLIGSANALVAQGAAAVAGVDSAVVLLVDQGRVRLLNLEEGVLRARSLRRSAGMGGLAFAQRHATQSALGGPAVAALTRDLVDERPVVLARVGAYVAGTDLDEKVQNLVAPLPDAYVVSEPAAVLAALGARASLPQCELVRYAVVSGPEEVEQIRRMVRRLAQGRVLGASAGPVELRTKADHYSALSFLTEGPVLVLTHVVGYPAQEAPA